MSPKNAQSKMCKKLEEEESIWVKLEQKERSKMLGFYHDTGTLLYIRNFTTMKNCPSNKLVDFLWEDINLPKKNVRKSGCPIQKLLLKERKKYRCSGQDVMGQDKTVLDMFLLTLL